jgi:hypothetical protein
LLSIKFYLKKVNGLHRTVPSNNSAILSNLYLSRVQNIAYAKVQRYRAFYNVSKMVMNETLNKYAGTRAINLANQNFQLFDGESTFGMCQYPKISNYNCKLIFKFIILLRLFRLSFF